MNILCFQIKKCFKNKNMLFQFFVLPVILLLSISYLLSGYFETFSLAVSHYFFPIMLFMYVGYGINATFSLLDVNNIEGNKRLFYMPVNQEWIIISNVFSQTIFGSISLIANFLSFYFVLSKYFQNLIGAYFLIVSLIFLSNMIGVFAILFSKNIILIEEIFTIFQILFTILGNMFFRLDCYSNFPVWLIKLSPLKWNIDAITNYISNGYIGNLLIVGFSQLIISLLIYFIIHIRFKTYDFF